MTDIKENPLLAEENEATISYSGASSFIFHTINLPSSGRSWILNGVE